MTTYLIKVVPYDPNWPHEFKLEENLLKSTLDDNYIAIHHIGSTSVPGLAAKPKIDILAVVQKRPLTIKNLETAGYEYRGEFNVPLHYMFRKRGKIDFNLHVYESDHSDIELLLMFRDYLRNNISARDEYAALKNKLLESDSSFEKNNSIYTGYTLGKNDFICSILEKVNFNRLRFVRCTHYNEWDAAKNLRQQYYFDNIAISDPYAWTYTHADHRHFVLYKGTKIIGYAHIQCIDNKSAKLYMLVIDESYRLNGFGRVFLGLIETWLREQGCTIIYTKASANTHLFYVAQGYEAMPFDKVCLNDNKLYDIKVGKNL